MKIGNSPDKPGAAGSAAPATPAAGAGEAAKAHGAATPAVPDASAKIELSSTASRLLASGSTPEFDADKVARMSQAIADGSFKVNPEAIADKLVANAHELLTKSQR